MRQVNLNIDFVLELIFNYSFLSLKNIVPKMVCVRPTLLQEKVVQPEIFPILSTILTISFLTVTFSLSLIYFLSWLPSTTVTNLSSAAGTCQQMSFRCLGCPTRPDAGCTLTGTGPLTIQSNHLNISQFTIIPVNTTVSISVCSGEDEWLLLGFNLSEIFPVGLYVGYCYYGSIGPGTFGYNLFGEIEIGPNIWSPLSSTKNQATDKTVHGSEYSRWTASFLNSSQIDQYYRPSLLLKSITTCWNNPQAGTNYWCKAIRLSSVTWNLVETRSSFLALSGVVGGLLGLCYRISFFVMWLIRRIYTRFILTSSREVNSNLENSKTASFLEISPKV